MHQSLFLHTVFYDGNIDWALAGNHLDRIIRFEPLSNDFIHHLGSVGANSRAWDLGENLILTNQESQRRVVGKFKEERAKSQESQASRHGRHPAGRILRTCKSSVLFAKPLVWFVLVFIAVVFRVKSRMLIS